MRYVEHVQKDVDQLSPNTIEKCFLSVVDPNSPKPDLSEDVILAAYYHRAESLKSLPNPVALNVRLRVLAHDKYADIARDNNLHPAEVAWLAKHVIRPEFEQRRHALDNIQIVKEGREYVRKELREVQAWRQKHWEPKRKQDNEEWLRKQELREERFSASELHNPGTKASQKAQLDSDSLDYSWHWMETKASQMKLNADEEGLLAWFRKTAERTFKWRRDKSREKANRQHEKLLIDFEAAA
jgi:uncharacterized protein YcbX